MKRFFWAVGFAVVLLVLFYVTRYALPELYTPEWAARNIFWPIAAVIFLPVLYGKVRFSGLALAGYVIGMIAGELLGGWESHVGPCYRHHGWWILILVFLIFCAAGVIVQRLARKK